MPRDRRSRTFLGQSSTPRRGWHLPAAILLVAVIVAAAHWPALDAKALAADDHQYLVSNPLVRNPSLGNAGRFLVEVFNPSTVGGYYQPLAMISLMLDTALGGGPDHLAPYHRTSLVLHLVNTALVIVLLHRLFGSVAAAVLAGLIFGVHPLTVEPIPWIGERKTLLAAMFALASLIVYVGHSLTWRASPLELKRGGQTGPRRGGQSEPGRVAPEIAARRGGRWRLWAALGLYVLALMSKPTSTPLPLAMLLMDVWPLRRFALWPLGRDAGRAIFEKLPFFVAGLASAVVTYVSQAATYVETPASHGIWRIPLMICHNVAFYLAKMFWPANLSAFYAFPDPLSPAHPMVLAGLILAPLLIVALAFLARRGMPAPLVGALIFFVMIFPTLGVIGFTVVIASDKYVYLPAIGLLMLLAAGLRWCLFDGRAPANANPLSTTTVRAKHRPRGAMTQLGAVSVCLVVITAEFAATRADLQHWQTTEGLYRHMLSLAPAAAKLHFGLGHHYEFTGQPDQAAACYRAALQHNPEDRDARLNLAGLLVDAGQVAAAMEHLAQLEARLPNDADVQNNIGLALGALGRHDDAVVRFQRALELQPRHVLALNNLGNTMGRQGRLDEAIANFRRALEIDPTMLTARLNLAFALQQAGQRQAAADEYERILLRNPADAKARAQLDALMSRMSREAKALSPKP